MNEKLPTGAQWDEFPIADPTTIKGAHAFIAHLGRLGMETMDLRTSLGRMHYTLKALRTTSPFEVVEYKKVLSSYRALLGRVQVLKKSAIEAAEHGQTLAKNLKVGDDASGKILGGTGALVRTLSNIYTEFNAELAKLDLKHQ